jgi:hypothetical protein
VQDGLQALEKTHRRHIEEDIRGEFGDSLDIDKGLQKGHEQENRWDYLLGLRGPRKIIALEPHTAATMELSTVIRKRAAAKKQLEEHFRPGVGVSDWFLVASGKVDYISTEKATLQLMQNGIRFVGRTLRRKALGL